jgi:hypothetical protein
MVDLQNNVSKEGASIVFSTGATIDSSRITGILFDWVAERPMPRAIVQALRLFEGAPAEAEPPRDTAYYTAVTDSSGRFVIPNLPDGSYQVRGFIDANSNRVRDSTEMYDTTRVTLNDSARVELLAFVHDPNPPRMLDAVVRDSFTIAVRFSRPLSPTLVFDTSMFHIYQRNSPTDSTAVPVVLVRPERPFERVTPADSLRQDSVRRADSVRALLRPDSVPRTVQQAVTPSRTRPPQTLILQVARQLTAGTYIVRAGELRGMMGPSGPHSISFVVAPRTPPPPPSGTSSSGGRLRRR